jgi:hypothetical protein
VGVEIWRFVAAIYYQTESEVVLCGVVRLARPRDTTQNLNASDWARDNLTPTHPPTATTPTTYCAVHISNLFIYRLSFFIPKSMK